MFSKKFFFWVSIISCLTACGKKDNSTPPPTPPPIPPLEYTCDELQWVQEPTVNNNILSSEVLVSCEFNGRTGGGFSELNRYFQNKVVETAQVVHSGPIAESYSDMDSNYYDLTILQTFGDLSLIARSDVHIASDNQNVVIFDLFSDEIADSNYPLSLLKSFEINTETVRTEASDRYCIRLLGKFSMEKIPLIPDPLLKTLIKDTIEKEVPSLEADVLEEISMHL